jgi:hypothetical protein
MTRQGATRRRALAAAAAGIGLVLALGGCGISASSQPRKLGDAYEPVAGPNFAHPAAEPTAADPAQLVEDYLHAAAGGNEAAINQVKLFLTGNGRKTWAAPGKGATASILIIQVDDVVTEAQKDNGTPVDLTYHEVGTLTDDGRIVPSNNTEEQTSHLRVVRAADQLGQLRIDSGALPGLVLSEDALDGTFYSPQPIYFWDASNQVASNQVLVPDLRYVPLTVPPDQRANKIIGWLQNGPSQLLDYAVNRLPTNTSATVASRASTLVIKLSSYAGGKGPDDARRMVYQLQASLQTISRDLEIWIGNSLAPSTGSTDYLHYELASALPVPMQKYDIIDGVVKPTTSDNASAAPNLQMLAASQNSAVLYAAISRDDAMGAFARAPTPDQKTLTLIPNSGKAITVRGLPQSDHISRPAWIPGIEGLLVGWGGGLYLVDLNGQANRLPTPGLGAITQVAVSPDGRRVAMMAGGQVTVAALLASNNQAEPSVRLADGPPQTIVPDPGLTPYGVSWDSEQKVDIVGRSSDGKPALWRVTTDGMVATDLSDTLKGVAPVDIVSYPAGIRDGETVVLQQNNVPYRVNSPQVSLDGTKSPFYVD